MSIDGGTVLWVFGICVACVGGLAKLVYNQLDKRVDIIEKAAHEDREAFLESISELYKELKDAQNRNQAGTDKLLAAILQVQMSVADVSKSLASHPINCLEKFATKTELEQVRHDVKASA